MATYPNFLQLETQDFTTVLNFKLVYAYKCSIRVVLIALFPSTCFFFLLFNSMITTNEPAHTVLKEKMVPGMP